MNFGVSHFHNSSTVLSFIGNLGKLMCLLSKFVFIVTRCTLEYDESGTAKCLHLIVIWNCRPYPVNEGKSECSRKRSTIDFIQTSTQTAQFQLSATIGFHAGNTTGLQVLSFVTPIALCPELSVSRRSETGNWVNIGVRQCVDIMALTAAGESYVDYREISVALR
ncbi:hypothetical protein CBL_01252 [Carabus blaptoides fortunei]